MVRLIDWRLHGAMTRLTDLDRLHTTLMTTSSIQETIRHADAKATALLTAQCALFALVGGSPSPPTGHTGEWSTSLTLAFVAFAAMASIRFTLTLWPRTKGASSTNRFAFTTIKDGEWRSDHVDIDQYLEDARDLAVTLAGVAATKHGHIRAGIPWLGLSALSAVAHAAPTWI